MSDRSIIRRITLLEMVEAPDIFLQMIEWRCWNMLGVGKAKWIEKDIATGDLIFYA